MVNRRPDMAVVTRAVGTVRGRGRWTRRAAPVAAVALAAWHIAPAAGWLPGVRRRFLPALDGQGDPRHVALTFDDGPDPRSTPHVLRTLDRLSVHATFFVLGSALERHPEIGRAIVGHGHELAVHGWEHDSPWFPTPRRDIRGVARTAAAVHRIAGEHPLWYRPPYGILTGGRWAAAHLAGLRPVLWSAWGRDWTSRAHADSVLTELGRTLRGGGTVLLHDSDRMGAEGAWRASLGALPDLVAACRAAGLSVGPLAEHGPAARPLFLRHRMTGTACAVPGASGYLSCGTEQGGPMSERLSEQTTPSQAEGEREEEVEQGPGEQPVFRPTPSQAEGEREEEAE